MKIKEPFEKVNPKAGFKAFYFCAKTNLHTNYKTNRNDRKH